MKIGVLINARLGSKRLPKKHLRDIGGKTAIERLLDRIEHIRACNVQIIIATGTQQENQPFLPIARQRRVEVFFGDSHNIPKRHLDCARAYNLDAIVSIDADDVLTSPVAMSEAISALEDGHQLVRTEGLPFGLNVLWGYAVEYLARPSIQSPPGGGNMDTGWGRVFPDKPYVCYHDICDAEKIRATLDYPEDLRFFRAVYEEIPGVESMDDTALCRAIIEKKIHRINKRWIAA